VAALPDGAILVAEATVLRRIGVDGSITTVGGTGTAGYNLASTPATSVAIATPPAVAALPDGRALVADALNDRVRLLAADGSSLKTVAGSGVPGPPGTPEPAPRATIDPPDSPSLNAKIVTTAPAPPAADSRGRQPFLRAPRSSCPGPGAKDPRRFTDLHLIPLSASSLRTGRKVSVKFALNRDASLVAKLTRSGKVVRSRSVKKVRAGERRVAIRGTVRPGTYMFALRATSSDGLKRCHALKLIVRK
jgi:hypothetical protein